MTTNPNAAPVHPFAPGRRAAIASRAARLPLVTLLALSAAENGLAVAPAGVTLRYGLKPGHDYQQAATMTLEMAVDPSSLPAGLAPLVQSMASGMKQEIEFKGVIDVQQRSADGATPFSFSLVEARGSFTRAGQTKDVPAITAAKDRPPLKGRFTADGRRVVLDAPAAADPAGADRRREQLAQALPELPEKAIVVGDSFEAVVPMRLPSAGGHSDSSLDTRWVYTLRAVDGSLATFDVRQVIPGANGTSLANGRLLGISGGASGSAIFDLKEGLFTRIALDAALDLTYAVPMPPGLSGAGTTTPAPATTEGAVAPTPPTLTLKSKLTGPIRLEMARGAAH